MEEQRIRVLIRPRPLSDAERARRDGKCIWTQGAPGGIRVGEAPPGVDRSFRFDHIFEETDGQAEVFEQLLPVLESALAGYNATIFTYGQTGTGKTHTMLGSNLWELAAATYRASSGGGGGSSAAAAHAPPPPSSVTRLMKPGGPGGLIPRCAAWLLQRSHAAAPPPSTARQRPGDSGGGGGGSGGSSAAPLRLSASYLEIYNERVFDLLAPRADGGSGDSAQPPPAALDIKMDGEGGVYVPGCVEARVRGEGDVAAALWAGARVRAVTATDMNLYSSRSHTIFTFGIDRGGGEGGGGGGASFSKLCLVDLAGSEKWDVFRSDTLSRARIREMTAINVSLSSLGNCIAALQQAGRTHVPYRDAKLTRLLQDSLGGNTLTAFVATVSPAASCLAETLSTCQFAERAAAVRLSVAAAGARLSDRGADPTLLLERYRAEVRRLRGALRAALAARGSGASSSSSAAALESAALLADDGSGGSSGGGGGGLPLQRRVERLQARLLAEREEKAALVAAACSVGASGAAAAAARRERAQLDAQRAALDAREAELDAIYEDQEAVWSWLEQQQRSGGDGGGSSDGGGGGGAAADGPVGAWLELERAHQTERRRCTVAVTHNGTWRAAGGGGGEDAAARDSSGDRSTSGSSGDGDGCGGAARGAAGSRSASNGGGGGSGGRSASGTARHVTLHERAWSPLGPSSRIPAASVVSPSASSRSAASRGAASRGGGGGSGGGSSEHAAGSERSSSVARGSRGAAAGAATAALWSKPVWREYVDGSTGQCYYYNRLTGVTQWDRPGSTGSASEGVSSSGGGGGGGGGGGRSSSPPRPRQLQRARRGDRSAAKGIGAAAALPRERARSTPGGAAWQPRRTPQAV